MAINVFANITTRDARGQFNQAMDSAPNVWETVSTKVPSSAANEDNVWLGQLPSPKEWTNGREFQGLLDFKYNIVNKEYELAFLIDRVSVEDDNTGAINRRISDAAKMWASFKDQQIATLIEDNGTSYTGSAFFADSHSIGDATIDNNIANDITNPTGAAMTAAEMLTELGRMSGLMESFNDDTNRGGYNSFAGQSFNLLGHSVYRRPAMEAINGTLVGGGNSNPFGNSMASFLALPYLTVGNTHIFLAATGDPGSLPFIYQERTPLEVQLFNSADAIADNHGLKVLIRQRYRLQYGEPRRIMKNVLS